MRISVFPGLSCANLLSTRQSAIVEMFYCCCQVAVVLKAFLLYPTDKGDDVVGGQKGKTREREHCLLQSQVQLLHVYVHMNTGCMLSCCVEVA